MAEGFPWPTRGRWTRVSQFPLGLFLHVLWKRTRGTTGTGFLWGRCPSQSTMSPNWEEHKAITPTSGLASSFLYLAVDPCLMKGVLLPLCQLSNATTARSPTITNPKNIMSVNRSHITFHYQLGMIQLFDRNNRVVTFTGFLVSGNGRCKTDTGRPSAGCCHSTRSSMQHISTITWSLPWCFWIPVVFLGHIVCIQCIKIRPTATHETANSVVCGCWSYAWDLQKQLNRLRCHFGVDSDEPKKSCIRQGSRSPMVGTTLEMSGPLKALWDSSAMLYTAKKSIMGSAGLRQP